MNGILLDLAVNKRQSFGEDCCVAPADADQTFSGKIPSLMKGVYKDASPMLTARFARYGRWAHATHGHWLSVADMETLWQDDIQDELLDQIKFQAECLKTDWDNNVFGLFREDRLSLFAGSDIGNEAIFLLWLDGCDEPELWVYDANGESRYANLEVYLAAYLADDVSAANVSWRL
ncbi:hypothetical protein [Corticimicrobacter populi]|nr:hypothetical protein [Corticimicrobacter populi]